MKPFMRVVGSRLFVLTAILAVAAFVPIAAFALPIVFGATTTALNPGGASDINQALKIFFNEPVIENIVHDSELLQIFQEDNNVKQDETTGGRYIETAQYFQLPGGVGARAENEYIPVPDGPVIQNSRVNLKKVQGVLEMTGDVMRRVKGDMGAYLNWAERALPDLVKRVDHEIDRMLFGYGNGAVAKIGGAIANPLPVDRNFGITGAFPVFLNFLEGMRIVASLNANGSPLRNPGAGQSRQVTAIDAAASPNTITLDSAAPAAWANGDFLFPGDDAGASTQDAAGVDREVQGLLGMVDDGSILATFQNLARATFKLWQSIMVDSTLAPYNSVLSEDLIVFADDEVYIKGGGKADCVVTSRSGARSFWKSVKGDRVINDPRAYTGGKGALTILLGDRDVVFKAPRKCPYNYTFLLQMDTFKRWTLGGWQWDDTTGAIWNRVTDATGRKDAYYAVGNLYMQLGCLAPRKNARINGLVAA